MIGKDIMIDYFQRVDDSLITLSRAAQMPRGDEKDTGENREHIVAEFLSDHLPALAVVTTSGVVIDAESAVNHAQQADVVVYNRFSFAPKLFPAGHFPAESVYLSLEVKSSARQIAHALSQCAGVKQLRKFLRPETTYFGFLSEPGASPNPSVRTGSPTAGIWIWPQDSESESSLDWLDDAVEVFGGDQTDDRQFRVNLPSCVFIPGKFLAFKIYPRTAEKLTAQYASEYWYCKNTGREHRSTGQHPVYYVEYQPTNQQGSPSRLQVFTLWLSQEILKFLHEVPDFFAYAFPRDTFSGRQGYSWKPESLDVLIDDGRDWKPLPKSVRAP
jgi:hypothetical protein